MTRDDEQYRRRSLWLETYPGSLTPRSPLDGDATADVAIVGGGYTGLWTAYSLLQRDPTIRVLVVERDIVGFGASGRNGGWCVGEMAAGYDALAKAGGRDGAIRQIRAAMDAVDAVGRAVDLEGIDCDYAKGGTVRLARNGAQLDRQRAEVAHLHELGFTDDDIRLLDADEARSQLAATDVLGGIFFAPTAAIHPAKLVRGLGEAVERRGGRIVEGTTVTSIGPGSVTTDRGRVRADVVVRAIEGYTKSLDGHARTLLPLYSLMVATEPLPAQMWDEIGLAQRQTFADDRHLVIYGQRTADDRIAFGGRGAPYGYGSRIAESIEASSAMHELIARTLVELLPIVGGAAITHRWGGVLGVPRDWFPSVGYDRRSGMAWGGGYVGEGVAISNLAGRTLADLITGADSGLGDLPWVGHRSRRWEPEPLRWLGINGALRMMGGADRVENHTNRPSRRAAVLDKVLRG